MAYASGVDASLGFAAETTYGTYVAPARWLEFENESLTKNKAVVQGGGLGTGRRVPRASRRVVTSRDAGGTFQVEAVNKGFGLLLAQALGSTATPVQQASTIAYLQTHTLGNPRGQSMTIQKGVPQIGATSATVNPYTLVGCKVTQTVIELDVNGLCLVTFTVDAQDMVENQTLVTPSYPTGLYPFHFGQSAFKIGVFGSEAQVDGVRKVTITIPAASRTDRQYQGNLGLKKEPVVNAQTAPTVAIDADYIDKTIFADRFASDAGFSLVWSVTGNNIVSTYYESLTVTLPSVQLDNDTPVVGSADIVTGTFNGTVLDDGTHPVVTAAYMSTDTTV